MFTKIIAWIVLSSKDPQKVSLMIKGAAAWAGTYILFFAGIFHFNVGQSDVASIFEAVAKFVEYALYAISAVSTVWGLIRKVKRTADGTNRVLNQL